MSEHESTYVPKTGVEKWLDSRLPIVRFAADYAAFLAWARDTWDTRDADYSHSRAKCCT